MQFGVFAQSQRTEPYQHTCQKKKGENYCSGFHLSDSFTCFPGFIGVIVILKLVYTTAQALKSVKLLPKGTLCIADGCSADSWTVAP